MFYPNNPYFILYADSNTMKPLHPYLAQLTVCCQAVFQTHSCEDVHLRLFGLRFCKLFGCEQNIKGDKQ